jgi:hypothetical protein
MNSKRKFSLCYCPIVEILERCCRFRWLSGRTGRYLHFPVETWGSTGWFGRLRRSPVRGGRVVNGRYWFLPFPLEGRCHAGEGQKQGGRELRYKLGDPLARRHCVAVVVLRQAEQWPFGSPAQSRRKERRFGRTVCRRVYCCMYRRAVAEARRSLGRRRVVSESEKAVRDLAAGGRISRTRSGGCTIASIT